MQHHTIPYNMSHFPISPLDLEFLLTGLDGLSDDGSSPTDDDLSEASYDEDVQSTGSLEVVTNVQTTG